MYHTWVSFASQAMKISLHQACVIRWFGQRLQKHIFWFVRTEIIFNYYSTRLLFSSTCFDRMCVVDHHWNVVVHIYRSLSVVTDIIYPDAYISKSTNNMAHVPTVNSLSINFRWQFAILRWAKLRLPLGFGARSEYYFIICKFDYWEWKINII